MKSRPFIALPTHYPRHSTIEDFGVRPEELTIVRENDRKSHGLLDGIGPGTVLLDPFYSASGRLGALLRIRGFNILRGLKPCRSYMKRLFHE